MAETASPNPSTPKVNVVNNNRRAASQKVSKLPVRMGGTSLAGAVAPSKKSSIPIPITSKPVPATAKSILKKPSQPSVVVQSPYNRIRSRLITTPDRSLTHTGIPTSMNRREKKPKAIDPVPSPKQVDDCIEQMNSTSSESSFEEQKRFDRPLAHITDEGYSTWSSSDVPTNAGHIKHWLDSTDESVKKGTPDRQRRSIQSESL